MLENKKLDNKFVEPVHMSRFVASWQNVNNSAGFHRSFEEWLKDLGVSEQDVRDTVEMATCGKLELEVNAREWYKNHPEISYYPELEKEREEKVKKPLIERLRLIGRFRSFL